MFFLGFSKLIVILSFRFLADYHIQLCNLDSQVFDLFAERLYFFRDVFAFQSLLNFVQLFFEVFD